MDNSFLKIIPWFYYPWYVSKENMLTDEVKLGLEKYRKEIEKIMDFDEAVLVLIFPIKKTEFQQEQEHMFRLVSIASANKNFETDLVFEQEARRYLAKYDWLTTFILTPSLPMSFTELVTRVKRAIKDNFSENFNVQKKATKKIIFQQKE